MINLLPETYQKEIRAGKSNVLLVRYCILSVVIAFVAAGGIALTWLMIDNVREFNQQIIAKNESSSFQLSAKQAEVEQFRTNLQTARTILAKQINYSAVALRVASTIPGGVIIDQLSLDPSAFDKPTTMVAHAVSENAAIRLRDSLAASPYYANVHFNSISQDGSDNGRYGVTVNLGLTIKKEILYE